MDKLDFKNYHTDFMKDRDVITVYYDSYKVNKQDVLEIKSQ